VEDARWGSPPDKGEHQMKLKIAILAVELLACAAVPLMALAVHAL
jgi:hypothetical protein